MEREGELLGIGLTNILHLFSPELILMGGGVIVHNPGLIARAAATIRARAIHVYHDVPVRLVALGDRAGILGAAALFLHMRGLV
jgi:glucokinase